MTTAYHCNNSISSNKNLQALTDHHRNQQLNTMSQNCSPAERPRMESDYAMSTETLKLVRSLLRKGQEQGMQQTANKPFISSTDCLQESNLPLMLLIFAICLTVIVVKMVVNLKAERRTMLTALGEAKWMDDSEKGMIRHEGLPLVQ